MKYLSMSGVLRSISPSYRRASHSKSEPSSTYWRAWPASSGCSLSMRAVTANPSWVYLSVGFMRFIVPHRAQLLGCALTRVDVWILIATIAGVVAK